jgi:hypothetical protein
LLVEATYSTRRVPIEPKNSTYSRRSQTVSSVKKSQARTVFPCWRRNDRQSSCPRRGAGGIPSRRRTSAGRAGHIQFGKRFNTGRALCVVVWPLVAGTPTCPPGTAISSSASKPSAELSLRRGRVSRKDLDMRDRSSGDPPRSVAVARVSANRRAAVSVMHWSRERQAL